MGLVIEAPYGGGDVGYADWDVYDPPRTIGLPDYAKDFPAWVDQWFGLDRYKTPGQAADEIDMWHRHQQSVKGRKFNPEQLQKWKEAVRLLRARQKQIDDHNRWLAEQNKRKREYKGPGKYKSPTSKKGPEFEQRQYRLPDPVPMPSGPDYQPGGGGIASLASKPAVLLGGAAVLGFFLMKKGA